MCVTVEAEAALSMSLFRLNRHRVLAVRHYINNAGGSGGLCAAAAHEQVSPRSVTADAALKKSLPFVRLPENIFAEIEV